MKILSLILSRFFNYLKINKIIFLVYLIGSIACCITFIYFYGNSVAYKVNEAKDDTLYKQYRITMSEPILYTDDLTEKISNDNEDEILLFSSIKIENIYNEAIITNKSNNIDYFIVASVYDNAKIYLKRGTNKFIGNNAGNNNADSIIIPSNILKTGSDLNTIYVNNKTYTIIGESNNINRFYLSYADYIKNSNYLTSYFEINLSKRLSESDNLQYVSKLYNIFQDSIINEPSKYYTDDNSDSIANITYLCIIYVICFFTFSFLIKYMIELNYVENIIYSIVGASKKKIIFLIFIDNMLIMSSALIISILIHILTYNSIFEALNVYQGISYNCYDYFIVFIIVLFISEIPMLPIALKYNNQTITKSNGDYK